MSRPCGAAVALAIAMAVLFSPSADAAGCVAMPLPSLRGADGSAPELAAGLRSLVSSFLTGPSLRTVPLEARLPDQAVEEARQKGCPIVLSVTWTRKRSGSGGLGRVLGQAADATAWRLPYGSSAGTIAARSAAIAGASAASNIASNVRAKDEMELEYRLVSGTTSMHDGRDRAKAKSDGEDLVTPLAERMAMAVAGALPR